MSAATTSETALARVEGRRVLAAEAAALADLAGAMTGPLGDAFDAAADLLFGVRGRIVATGMGKSGHVARKIAATLASTGAPALYVHPGEASHGDLGMMTAEDALLALSNSGETAELSDILAHCQRIGAPVVALTSRAPSTLADAATVALVPPPAEEACPMGLAPMTSTTVALALGDALAAALLHRRGFAASDFRALHPGGKLGRGLMRLADVMHKGARLPLVAADALMADALIEMSTKGFGCVGAVDSAGGLAGLVTDGDLRRHMGADLIHRIVATVMTKNPRTVPADMFVAEALKLMNDRQITALFIVEDGRPHGLVHLHDLLRLGVA